MHFLTSLPPAARVLVVVVTLAGLTAIFLFLASVSGFAAIVLGAGLLGVLALLGVYALALKLLDRQRGSRLASLLGRHNASASIGSAAQRARLDDLRRMFEEGVEKFRNAGKDLYSLPWYAVVGEPGSGKTEAVRHSNVGFPPGLQDELQGTGGTINMNWWFTNYAVFLDTAGRLIFEDIVPGSINEWQEFLKLLKKVRPNCPINGMLLAIPADTLIKDRPEELDRKARKLAGQLTDIQRTLDIRFPVFVLVTKSDLVPGFREFFENIHDPQLQHQMVGWSNPEPLDAPFQPAELDQYLDRYLHALYRRRLGLIQDPSPRLPGGKRIDELDVLFNYPSSLRGIFPRLRRYLEILFGAGEWASRPLFFRGIYFTSSVQEGSALDEELAKALALPVDALPEGKVWEKERAFFLRDLCMEKIFKESRLITRASNARQQLRQRQTLLLGAGIAGLLALAAFSFYGGRALRQALGGQVPFWQYGADPALLDSTDDALPPVVYEGREPGTYINNAEGVLDLGGEQITVAAFHEKIRSLAEREVQVPLIFRLLNLGVDNERRLAAQRVLFETGVVQPLVAAAREKIERLTAADWNEEATRVLVLLLQAEQEIASRQAGLPGDPLADTNLLDPLMRFVAGESAGPALAAVFEKTYYTGKPRDPAAAWPPAWLSGGPTLRENTALARGLQTWLESLRAAQRSRLDALTALRDALLQADGFASAESDLLAAAAEADSIPDWEDLEEAYTRYRDRFGRLDGAIQAWEKTLAPRAGAAAPPGLYDTYRDLVDSTLQDFNRGLEPVQRLLAGPAAGLSRAGEGAPGNEAYLLFQQVGQLLERERQTVAQTFSTGLSTAQVEKLQDFDGRFLDTDGGRRPFSFRFRANLYSALLDPSAGFLPAEPPAPGQWEQTFGPVRQRLDSLLDEVSDYRGGLQREFRASLPPAFAFQSARGLSALARAYGAAAAASVRAAAGFPLVADADARVLTAADIVAFRGALQALDTDLKAPSMQLLPAADRAALQAFRDQLEPLARVAALLLTAAGNVQTCEVTLPSEAVQRELLDAWYPGLGFSAVYAGRLYRDLALGAGTKFRSYQAADRALGKIPLDAAELPLRFFQTAESTDPEEEMKLRRDWIPFRLLTEAKAQPPAKADGSWHVLVELPTTGSNPVALVLGLRFSSPLPAPGEWPTLAGLPAF